MSIAAEATKTAWPLERVKQAIRAAKARGENLRNLGGFVRAALRGGWLPPAPVASHPSDLGERPQRVVKALRPIPPDWLPGVDYEAARSFCNEAARLIRLEGTERPGDTEIRDRARLRAIAYQFVNILSKNISSQPARKRRFLTPTLLVRSWLRRFTQK